MHGGGCIVGGIVVGGGGAAVVAVVVIVMVIAVVLVMSLVSPSSCLSVQEGVAAVVATVAAPYSIYRGS